MRNRVGKLVVARGDHRLGLPQGLAGQPLVGGELEADEVGGKTVDGGAAERAARRVEQVAVGGVDLEQLRHLVDEELEDCVELELASERLRGLQEAGLLLDPPLVLRQEARRVQRERRLAGHRLRHRHLGLRPGTGDRAVEAEDADRLVEDDDRGREHRGRTELPQPVAAAELRGAEPGRRLEVLDRDGAPLAQGEVRDRKVLRALAERRRAGGQPLGDDRRRLARPAKAHEAPVDSESRADLRDGDLEQRVDVELRAHPHRHPRHEPLPVERLLERGRRPCPLERKRRVAGERLHERDLVRRERPPLPRRHADEHAQHPLLRDQRHPDPALRPHALDEARADAARVLDVVDRDRGRVEHGARDPRRLVHQVEPHLAPPVELALLAEREEAHRLAAVVGHEREGGELDAEERDHVLEQEHRRRLRVARPRERRRDGGHGLELALPDRRLLLGRARPDAARDEGALAPAGEEEERRQEGDEGRGEGRPQLPSERTLVGEDDGAVDRDREGDAGEERAEADVDRSQPAAVAPEARNERQTDAEVQRREDEKRHRVEDHGLRFGVHWALVMIGRAGIGGGISWLKR